MKKTILTAAAFAMLAFTSCSSELDIAKHGNVAPLEEYYSTDEEVLSGVAAMYAQLQTFHKEIFYTLNSLDDDTWSGGAVRGDNMDLEKLHEYNFGTNTSWMANMYQGLYSLIYKACLITEKVTPDTPTKQTAIAEAQAMRALANFYLAALWGNAPLVDHLLTASEYRVSQSEPGELWASIEKDLNEAISSGKMLSKNSIGDRTTGARMTKETAQALLGKAFLWQKKYAEAAAQFEKVIGSGLYGLWGIAEPGELDVLKHTPARNCCESMLEIQWIFDPSQAWGHLTDLWCAMGMRDSYYNVENPTFALGGWGFMNPTRDLYNAFVKEEGPEGYRLKSTVRTLAQMKEAGITPKVSFLLPGFEGIFNWKYRLLKEDLQMDVQGFQVLQFNNFSLLRYGEVLLLAAEANLMAGNQAKADDYVNQIRQRAQLAPKTGVTLEDIKIEKRLELAIEAVRFMDLVRWGDAEKVLGEQGKYIPGYHYDLETGTETINPTEYTNTVYGFKEKHKLFPYPELELNVNPNIAQNPGW